MADNSLRTRVNVIDEPDEPNKVDLKSTKVNSEQQWTAFTYFIAQKPVNNIHGLFKVICTGMTADAVQNEVHRLIDNGELEETLPFINISKTGTWRKLIPGGDPKADKEKYEPATKAVKTMAIMDNHQRRADAERELRERQRQLLDEQEKQEDEFSYDRYVILRNRLMDYDFKEKEIDDRKKAIQKARIKVTNEVKHIESKMGNFKFTFAKRMNEELAVQQQQALQQAQQHNQEITARRQALLDNEKSKQTIEQTIETINQNNDGTSEQNNDEYNTTFVSNT